MEDQNLDSFLAYVALIEESNDQFSQEQVKKLELIRSKVGEILKRVQPTPISNPSQVQVPYQITEQPTVNQNFNIPEKIVYGFSEYTSINEKIEKRNGKWVVLDSSGKKVLGTHSTKKEAVDQLQAIEISKNK